MPAAAHTEKDGSFTNTQRLLQWHHKAVEPAGDAAQRAVVHVPPRPHHPGEAGRLDRRDGPADPRPRPGTTRPQGALDEPSAEAVLAEINGCGRRRRPAVGATPSSRTTARPPCGCWIYCGVLRRRRQPGRAAQARQRAELGRARVGVGVAGEPAHPLQPRVGRSRRQAVERAQGLRLVGRRRAEVDRPRRARLHGRPSRPTTSRPTAPRRRTRSAGADPFVMQADGKAWLFAPTGLTDGPLPTHYEPQESPFDNPLYGQQCNPARAVLRARTTATTRPAVRPGSDVFPYRRDDVPADRAPHGRRDEPVAAIPAPSCSRSSSARSRPELAARARPRAPRLGDDRHRAHRDRGPGAGDRPDRAADASRAGRSIRSGCPITGDRTGYAPATRPTS